jgi:hypothetical protein
MITRVETMPTPPLRIQLPDTTIELLPVPRTHLIELRKCFLALHTAWLTATFSTGEVVASAEGWDLMKKIIALLPRKENPAVTGFDLETISNDYSQLQELFFFSETPPEILHSHATVTFNFDVFQPCQILSLHQINHKQLLMDAEAERQRRLSAALESTDEAVEDSE